jgi:hypothetical protein
LGKFDVVYAWGVLHHTGDLWRAMELAATPVGPGGTLFLALYNDQGWASRCWRLVKKTYCRAPRWLKPAILYPAALRLWGPQTLRDFLRLKPFQTWKTYQSARGMSAWRDVVDWVGGYPFEVAKPEEVIEFYRRRGFALCRCETVGAGRGNNQFVFQRSKEPDTP